MVVKTRRESVEKITSLKTSRMTTKGEEKTRRRGWCRGRRRKEEERWKRLEWEMKMGEREYSRHGSLMSVCLFFPFL